MKKAIPVFIGAVFIAYFALYLIIPLSLFNTDEPMVAKLIVAGMGAGALGLIAAMIATIWERVKEIDQEDKDDISKY